MSRVLRMRSTVRSLLQERSSRSTTLPLVRRSVVSTSHLLNGPEPSIQPASPLPATAFRYLRTRSGDTTRCEIELHRPLNFGVAIVGDRESYLVERSGNYTKTLTRGVYLLNPFLDRIAHVQTSEDQVIPIPPDQPFLTKDNDQLFIRGWLHIHVVDPYLASYGVENRTPPVLELVWEAMRREVGNRTRLETFQSLVVISDNVVEAVNGVVRGRGLKCTFLGMYYIANKAVMDKVKKEVEGRRAKRWF